MRPKGDGADPRIHVGELGDDGVGDVDGRSQSPHQRPEEILSRAAGRPFDDVAECAKIVAKRRHGGTFPVGNSQICVVHLCKQSFVVTRLDDHRRPQQSTFLGHQLVRLVQLRYIIPGMSRFLGSARCKALLDNRLSEEDLGGFGGMTPMAGRSSSSLTNREPFLFGLCGGRCGPEWTGVAPRPAPATASPSDRDRVIEATTPR